MMCAIKAKAEKIFVEILAAARVFQLCRVGGGAPRWCRNLIGQPRWHPAVPDNEW